jgi:hypothetical protein
VEDQPIDDARPFTRLLGPKLGDPLSGCRLVDLDRSSGAGGQELAVGREGDRDHPRRFCGVLHLPAPLAGRRVPDAQRAIDADRREQGPVGGKSQGGDVLLVGFPGAHGGVLVGFSTVSPSCPARPSQASSALL